MKNEVLGTLAIFSKKDTFEVSLDHRHIEVQKTTYIYNILEVLGEDGAIGSMITTAVVCPILYGYVTHYIFGDKHKNWKVKKYKSKKYPGSMDIEKALQQIKNKKINTIYDLASVLQIKRRDALGEKLTIDEKTFVYISKTLKIPTQEIESFFNLPLGTVDNILYSINTKLGQK